VNLRKDHYRVRVASARPTSQPCVYVTSQLLRRDRPVRGTPDLYWSGERPPTADANIEDDEDGLAGVREFRMPSTQVAIVGYGVLGEALGKIFPDAVVHDPPRGIDALDAVNACRVAFVCVPTPAAPDGSCDISCVEDAVATVSSEVIVICSTVPPGTGMSPSPNTELKMKRNMRGKTKVKNAAAGLRQKARIS